MDPTSVPARRGRKTGPMLRIDPIALQREMVAHNVTAQGLASITGISLQTVKRLMAGGTTTANSIAESLAAALEIDITALVIR